MIQRYMDKVGKYTPVDASEVLAEYTDSADVAPWFEDSVAWAVSAGIMGQNTGGYLWSNDLITRAQAAKMAVTAQPEKLVSTDSEKGE